jgi:hypothetical protein
MLESGVSKEAHQKSVAKLKTVMANSRKRAQGNKPNNIAIARLMKKKQ